MNWIRLKRCMCNILCSFLEHLVKIRVRITHDDVRLSLYKKVNKEMITRTTYIVANFIVYFVQKWQSFYRKIYFLTNLIPNSLHDCMQSQVKGTVVTSVCVWKFLSIIWVDFCSDHSNWCLEYYIQNGGKMILIHTMRLCLAWK